METKFQTQTQSACTSFSQEGGFLTGARKFRLAAVVTILLLMPLFVNLINQLLHMVSYESSVDLFTNTLLSVGNAAFMFFIAPHVLSGKHAKILGIVATVLLGLLLVVDLFECIWQFRGIENGDYYRYSDMLCSTTYCVIHTLRHLLSIAFFVLLAIGCDKKYRMGLIIIAVAKLFSAILFFPKLSLPLFGNMYFYVLMSSLGSIGWAYLLYQSLLLPGKKAPKKLALEEQQTSGDILLRVFNIAAATCLFIFVIFGTFFKPEDKGGSYFHYYENFMPAGGFILEFASLFLIASMVVLSIRFKTMSTKITGFVLAGLLLTVNLALVVMSTVVEPENMTDGMNMTNIITIALYALMSTVWLWIAKAQCNGTARKATALSVTATLTFLALIKSVNALQYQNYKFYDFGTTYIDAVVIIVALFMLLPWIMLQLINLSWPKMRLLFVAVPLAIAMFGFTALRLYMNGSWDRRNTTDSYSFSSTSDEEEADSVAVYTEDFDSLSDDEYTEPDYTGDDYDMY